MTNCILTGLPIVENNEAHRIIVDDHWVYWYGLNVNGDRVIINVCQSLMENYNWDKEIESTLTANRLVLTGELLKDNFKPYINKIFHWNCKIEEKPNHINLKDLIADIKKRADYPTTRKEKSDNLLKFLYNNQSFEGSEVLISSEMDFFGKLYFNSFDEMQFFLRELKGLGLINYDEIANKVQFTFKGLDFFDIFKKPTNGSVNVSVKLKYQIGLSFAGEDREYVEQVATELRRLGISVFYDGFEKVRLWGKDLYQHLNDIYKNQCEYCIIFISEHYAKKMWTAHELKSAQARDFKEYEEYILPVRFDKTELPGMNSTVGYLDCNTISAIELADLASKKLQNKA